MAPRVLFWLATLVPIYCYLGYPLALIILARFIRREVRKRPFEPLVTLLIPAYNEARSIRQKIVNSLALDYPAERLEIVVACDGSTDATPSLAQSFADGTRVRVLSFPDNRGKMATLNAAMPGLGGEIVVFSDATAMLERGSLRRLLENFADPSVGAASGVYKVLQAENANIGTSEDFYWRYETLLKIQESRLASTLGAHGHLHAIRKSLYPYPPEATINDDYVIPTSVIGRGYRAVYEPAAVVYEEAREMTGFGRRVRIMAGNIQQLRELRGLLSPPRPLELFFFFSHKICRLLVPFAMLVALAANTALADQSPYGSLLFAQLAFYGLALCGLVWRLRPKLLMLPYYFSMINAAAFFGVYHSLTRRRGMAWK